MKTFPGSSDLTLLPPPSLPLEVSAEVKDKLAALAGEEPLPLPARDRIRLLVQSPYRLYLYWNFRENPFATLMRTFGSRAPSFRFGVRLHDLTTNVTHFSEAGLDETGRAGEYWFDAQPDHQYVAHVGFMSEANLFTRLLTSDSALTPRVSVSPRTADSSVFKSPAAEFGKILSETGYVRDAIAMQIERADEISAGALSRTFFQLLVGDDTTGQEDLDDETLRALVLALAIGETLDRITLSANLRARLESKLAGRDLVKLRRELAAKLEFEIEEFDFFETLDVEPQHWSSDSIGGSRVRVLRRRTAWLPSLDHELHQAFGSARVGVPRVSKM